MAKGDDPFACGKGDVGAGLAVGNCGCVVPKEEEGVGGAEVEEGGAINPNG